MFRYLQVVQVVWGIFFQLGWSHKFVTCWWVVGSFLPLSHPQKIDHPWLLPAGDMEQSQPSDSASADVSNWPLVCRKTRGSPGRWTKWSKKHQTLYRPGDSIRALFIPQSLEKGHLTIPKRSLWITRYIFFSFFTYLSGLLAISLACPGLFTTRNPITKAWIIRITTKTSSNTSISISNNSNGSNSLCFRNPSWR